MKQAKTARKNRWSALPFADKVLLFFLAASFVFVVYYIFQGSRMDFSSDCATANLLAREIRATGQLFPDTWIYGNEVWWYFLHIPMALLSGIIQNQFLLRATTVFLYTLVLMILVWFFSKKIAKNNFYLVFLPLLFMGLSFESTYIMFGEAAYGFSFHIILAMLLFGILACKEDLCLSTPAFVGFTVLLGYLSLFSLRMLLAYGLPLLFAILFVYLLDHRKMEPAQAKKAFLRILVWAGISFIVICAGVAVNFFVTDANHVERGVIGFSLIDPLQPADIQTAFTNHLTQILVLFGYRGGIPAMSLGGVASFIHIAVGLLLAFVFPVLLTRKYREQTLFMRRFIVFTWTSFFINAVLLLFSQMGLEYAARYYLINVLFLLMLSCYYIYEYILKSAPLNRLFALMCVAAILAFSPLTLLRTRKFAQAQAEARYEELEAGLEEHDLHFGYASYWNAYKYSVLYDFDPEFAAVTLPDTQAFFWLTSSRLYQPDYCEGDTFLMFDEATEAPDGKMQERLARRFGEPKEIFSCAGYLFYVYDYNISERFISNVSLDHAGASQDLTVLMYFSEDGHANGVKDGVEELPQDIVHGPYISLQKGTYRLTLTLSSNADKIPIVVKSSLTNIIAQGEIDADGGAFVFELQEDMEKVEFVLSNSTGGQIDLVSITLQKIR